MVRPRTVSIHEVIQDCINGCTAHNADENKMSFYIYYNVRTHGRRRDCYYYVKELSLLERSIYNIINDNVDKNTDVFINTIKINFKGRDVQVNKSPYHYSLAYYMELLLRR